MKFTNIIILTISMLWTLPLKAHDMSSLISQEIKNPGLLKRISNKDKIFNIGVRNEYMKRQIISPTIGSKFLEKITGESYSENEGIGYEDFLWPQNSLLNVCFFNGSMIARQKIIDIAQIVFSHSNLTLENSIRNCTEEIKYAVRVLFVSKNDTSRAEIGKVAMSRKSDQPTVWLSDMEHILFPSKQQKSIILHEFMHVIGAAHEHQHPSKDCENIVDIEKISKIWNWTQDEARKQLQKLIPRSEGGIYAYRIMKFDEDSIMHYFIPEYLCKEKYESECKCGVNNLELSDGDVTLIKELYPTIEASK